MTPDGAGALPGTIAAIHRRGPLPFADFMELALYGPEGFFTTGRGAGRARDFITSPEVGSLFGAVLARAIDTWWDEAGQPDQWVVVDAGAGAGSLGRAILGAHPRCAEAMELVLVERSEQLRAEHPPEATSLAELPAGPFPGVVVANELLDNLPFSVMERRAGGWQEVRVGEEGGTLVEVVVPAAPELADEAAHHAPDAPDGARIPLQHAAREWVHDALGLLDGGRLVVVDYGRTTGEMAAEGGWLRTYRSHGRGVGALERVGEQDITADVAVDQLPGHPTRSTQAELLVRHGLEVLVADARSTWRERAAVGDLEALRARSRVSEADALADPAGLGGFAVLEWPARR